MKKIKFSVGVLAFMGLAAINFTQSESRFISKAFASTYYSDYSYSETYVSTTSSEPKKKCVEDDCCISVEVGFATATFEGKYEKCLDGNTVSDCKKCKPCDAQVNIF
jgi:hypothetical protein